MLNYVGGFFFRRRQWCQCTCAEGETGLLAHVAQADGDTVASSRLQALQLVLHRVALIAHLVVPLRLAHHVSHVDGVHLKGKQRESSSTGRRSTCITYINDRLQPVRVSEKINKSSLCRLHYNLNTDMADGAKQAGLWYLKNF